MIEAVTFEAHDNLIHFRWFPRSMRLAERLRAAGIEVSDDRARAVAGACTRWEEDHHLHGARVPDGWFHDRDAAGLRAGGFTDDVDDMLARLAAAAGRIPPGCADTYGYLPDPDVPAVLDELKGRGLRLGVVSDMPHNLNDILRALGLRDYFDVVVTCGNLEVPYPGLAPGTIKPDLSVYAVACRELGTTPQQCLHVGDSPYDDGGFVQCGARVVIYDPLDCLDVEGERVSRLMDVLPLIDAQGR